MKKTIFISAFILLAGALPARASTIGSFTIDSTNCNSTGGCYGLEWTLAVDQLSTAQLFNGVLYDYMATLTVQDDPTVNTPSASYTVSAVDFKVTSSQIDSAALYSFPSSSSGWATGINVLNAGGCTNNSNPGFVCSQTSTDPANFTSSNIVTWVWLFNTAGVISPNMIGDHIGAKMTDLSTPGKLLSASYTVPEPGTLGLLLAGFATAFAARARRRTTVKL